MKGFNQIKIDSRNVKKGDIFVAIKGKTKMGILSTECFS